MHMRVSGPATLHLLQSFKERWDKEREWRKPPETVPTCIRSRFPTFKATGQEGGQWVTQVLRSIDDNSAKFENRGRPGLVQVGGSWVDTSIQSGVVEVIRNAQEFLYIESQYFAGSSVHWDCETWDVGDRIFNIIDNAVNTVPYEIIKRIIQKIRLRQQFCVYVVMSMLPDIEYENLLYLIMADSNIICQYETIRMMYHKIGEELRAVGSCLHPTDYLVFLCMGKQEPKPTYVHSKMVIADDCYIVAGSANLIDRSLAGNQDTEIAILAQQLTTVGDNQVMSDGHIHKLRRKLWAEHTGGLSEFDPALARPGTLDAIRRLKELANEGLR
ncbi:uncharacterized protein [Penaeus vannamei]|uniref:uncharacterized protein n=1 Tax=Penaeus vannamei TaxID=6689 RepID=UPI00387F856A